MAARIQVRVVPGAPRDAVDGEMSDGRVKLRLRARAVEGAANEALVAFVAGRLGVPRRAVRIASGLTARMKTLEVEGLDAGEARRRLLES
ncbi:MAG: DUF167 domain-containing protein [Candidatus Eisenbacteria bacterium]|nr:DUF167 domain-containing protein [Candidatus Eisenbacteria bacterium]